MKGFRWHKLEHINVLELRGLLHTLLWRCRKVSFQGSRWLHLLDSQVALSVATKGRSSSKALNNVLRRLAALQLASNSYMLLAYVAGPDNPADEPSRFFEA